MEKELKTSRKKLEEERECIEASHNLELKRISDEKHVLSLDNAKFDFVVKELQEELGKINRENAEVKNLLEMAQHEYQQLEIEKNELEQENHDDEDLITD